MTTKEQQNLKNQAFTAQAWPVPCAPTHYPENQALPDLKNDTAITLSGGGIRALVGAAGVLRALNHNNILDKFDYLSGVSGGAWAGTIYSYADVPLESLLGAIHSSPSALNQEILTTLNESCMYASVTKNIFPKLLHDSATIQEDELWINLVGDLYLEPFGLAGDKYFTLNLETATKIINANPALLNPGDFHYLQSNRPYPIFSSTGIWPGQLLDVANWFVVEFSPVASGVPGNLTLYSTGYFEQNIAKQLPQMKFGGYVESFAFNSSSAPISGINTGTVQYVTVGQPNYRFSLKRAAGCASAYASIVLVKIPLEFIKGLVPILDLWPVDANPDAYEPGASVASVSFSAEGTKSKNYNDTPAPSANTDQTQNTYMGDGGNLENYGIMQMLNRQLKNIVVCIFSETTLDNPYVKDYMWYNIDGWLPPLFGYYSNQFWIRDYGAPTTQVFDATYFQSVVDGLLALKKQGKPMLYKTNFPVLSNIQFGVMSQTGSGADLKPYAPNIIWYYMDKSSEWESLLNSDIQAELNKGSSGHYPGFPNYSTAGPNFKILDPPSWENFGQLDADQANLLAEYNFWAFNENIDLIKNLFT